MTDEEKAEEILQTKGCMTFCAKGCGYTEKVKELIAIGLAEGRKEIFPSFTKKKEMLEAKVSILEEENARLKADLDSYKAFDSHYDEIEEDAKWIAEENEELKAQIEKMKCCENCKWCIFEEYGERSCGCFDVCHIYEKWEMKE